MAAVPQPLVVALQKFYHQGIPFSDIERVATLIADLLPAASPPPPPRVAPPLAPKAPPKRLGRPPKARRLGRPPQVRRPAPRDEGQAGSLADQARALLDRGPQTAQQVTQKLGLDEGAAHPLLARIGAKPVGEIEDPTDGTTLKTYGLPG